MPVPVTKTTATVAPPEITMRQYGDGSIEYTNACSSVSRRLHSDHEYLVELSDMIDSILNP
jgi:hypothetical protein